MKLGGGFLLWGYIAWIWFSWWNDEQRYSDPPRPLWRARPG